MCFEQDKCVCDDKSVNVLSTSASPVHECDDRICQSSAQRKVSVYITSLSCALYVEGYIFHTYREETTRFVSKTEI